MEYLLTSFTIRVTDRILHIWNADQKPIYREYEGQKILEEKLSSSVNVSQYLEKTLFKNIGKNIRFEYFDQKGRIATFSTPPEQLKLIKIYSKDPDFAGLYPSIVIPLPETLETKYRALQENLIHHLDGFQANRLVKKLGYTESPHPFGRTYRKWVITLFEVHRQMNILNVGSLYSLLAHPDIGCGNLIRFIRDYDVQIGVKR